MGFEIELFNEVGQLNFSKKIKMNVGKTEYLLPRLEEEGLYFLKIKSEEGRGRCLKLVVD
ncbi:MAG TPA: T9SS type A sorting domain-containing protein [Phaeodactylibacter sp.]|nr:T9SS type A sorting domain-containing protein [Phaeodactylibacter sp.]